MVDLKMVYCVVDSETGGKVSQFYTRLGDAKRKSKQLNAWFGKTKYKPCSFELTNKVEHE